MHVLAVPNLFIITGATVAAAIVVIVVALRSRIWIRLPFLQYHALKMFFLFLFLFFFFYKSSANIGSRMGRMIWAELATPPANEYEHITSMPRKLYNTAVITNIHNAQLVNFLTPSSLYTHIATEICDVYYCHYYFSFFIIVVVVVVFSLLITCFLFV